MTSKTRSSFTTNDARWKAVCARDARADSHFVYGVRTTGVYCKPSSPAKRPLRKNVEFFESAKAAQAAGYRASRRSDKTAVAAEHAAVVAKICKRIEAADALPKLEDLAAQAGLSAFHFHKIFKAQTGLTPKAYANAARARKLRRELDRKTASVTDAIYEAGFGSSSRFYEASDRTLGMRARDYRAGGAGLPIRFAVGQCSLGAILVAQSARGICAIAMGDDPNQLVRDLQDQFPNAELLGADKSFARLVATVVGFVETPSLGLSLPLDVRGTAFQERVWQALRKIPAGKTLSYTELAKRIGKPSAVRAVASACASNRIAVAIPCHRVVRSDGDLSGYRWGVPRKRALLQRESKRA